MAAGGPNGMNSVPTWDEVITPFSLVTIAHARGGNLQVTMIGVVVSVNQSLVRGPGGVQRGITIQGGDFGLMFTLNTFYNLFTLTGLGPASLGVLGLSATLDDGLLHGTPAQVGKRWYNEIMGGSGTNGILAKTQFPYGNSYVTFPNIMASGFQEYPTQAAIPSTASYLSDESTWAAKFNNIMPFPFYENFVVTAPVGFYAQASGAVSPIKVGNYGQASPTFVCRVNPLPWTSVAATGSGFAYDSSLWDGLPTFAYNTGPISSNLSYTENDVHNLYVINPTTLQGTPGNSNSNTWLFMYQFQSWIDTGSIHRYGYRPMVTEFSWWDDQAGISAQQNANQPQGYFDTLVKYLALKVTSYYEPTPFMTNGSFTLNLSPTIMPGCKFTTYPYKDGVEWTYYINAVSHTFSFGSAATTTLNVSRGLPTATYNDVALMTALHTGNAQKKDGKLTALTNNKTGLTEFSQATAAAIMANIAGVWNTPQSSPGNQ